MLHGEYTTWECGRPKFIHCKGSCRTIVAKGVGVGPTFRLEPTFDYSELVIEMAEDGGLLGKHETAMCVACKTRILDLGPRPGELAAIYAQDIEQWIAEAVRGGTSQMEIGQAVNRLSKRRPVRELFEKGRGEA